MKTTQIQEIRENDFEITLEDARGQLDWIRNIKLLVCEPMLGMMPGDERLFTTHLKGKAVEEIPSDEYDALKTSKDKQIAQHMAAGDTEAEASEKVEEIIQLGTTFFPRTSEGKPFFWDYQLKGFFKDVISMLNRKTGRDKTTAHKKIVDGMFFPFPRKAEIIVDPALLQAPLEFVERPLRASTAKGERICLARSEMLPAGVEIVFQMGLTCGSQVKLVEECLSYGVLRGLSQWRNASWGRFKWAYEPNEAIDKSPAKKSSKKAS